VEEKQLPAVQERMLPALGDPTYWVERPGVLEQIDKLAEVCKDSGYFEKDNSVARAKIKIMAGMELGLSAFEAMQGVYVQHGKIGIEGKTIAAKIRSSGRYDYEIVHSDKAKCVVEFFKINPDGSKKSQGTQEITYEQCKTAGWTKNAQYQTNTENMLFYRAITFGYRRCCPDVFKIQVYSKEELDDGDVVDAEKVTLTKEVSKRSKSKAEARAEEHSAAEPAQAQAEAEPTDVEVKDEPKPTTSETLQTVAEVAEEKGLTKAAEAAKAANEDLNKVTTQDTVKLMKAGTGNGWKANQIIDKAAELFKVEKAKWQQQINRDQYEQLLKLVQENKPA